jgi:hypothetical protein
VYLGDYQLKVTRSFTPACWAHPDSRMPARDVEQLKALRLAYYLFNCGLQKERREELVALLTKEFAMKFRWFRASVQEIRS